MPTRPAWKNGSAGARLARTALESTPSAVGAPDHEDVRAEDDRRAALDAGRRQVRLGEVLPAGERAVAVRDGPVDLVPRARGVAARPRRRARRWPRSRPRRPWQPAGCTGRRSPTGAAGAARATGFGAGGLERRRRAEVAALDGTDRAGGTGAAVQPDVVADLGDRRVRHRDEEIRLGLERPERTLRIQRGLPDGRRRGAVARRGRRPPGARPRR